ncbi:hypothetical protein [Hamadaea tsunoensis]|uniref:hypothetical protein n=1 Tax=Hamadaea tsunoensis TaxID=53368 RepID=UPI0004287572|nr:hypothetical protein [Hamadaea tsunoensis]
MSKITARHALTRQVDLLVGQVAHWPSPRWRDRGETVYALVQDFADAGAEAEGRPRRGVPRLADANLPDQLRVTVADALAAGVPDEELARLAGRVEAVRRSL